MTFRRDLLFVLPVLLAATACAGNRSPGVTPQTTVVVSDPVPDAAPAADLPPLPVSIVESPRSGGRRIQNLEVVDQDIRSVIQAIAAEYNMSYQLNPAVTGRVSARLQDVTLEQALDVIVSPLGYTYEVQDNVLRIVPTQIATRIFTLDYMSLSRYGTGSTVIQRRLGGANSLAGGGGGTGDLIQTATIADLWTEIRISLEGLLFGASTALADSGNSEVQDTDDNSGQTSGTSGGTAGTTQQGAGIGGNGGGTSGNGGSGSNGVTGPGAYSRVDANGTRLIINPLAGTILVSAPESKLAEVDALLNAIEGSVHRQVLIEARIVEVRLNRNYQFGIDWSALRSIGNLDIRLGASATGAQLTLGGGGDEQIGTVLNALEEQGDVNVLSAPRVSVLNNQRAMINVATDEVFFAVTRQPIIGPNGGTIGFNTQIEPQQIAVGIVLDVHPQIATDNTITMNVRPVITDVVEVREVRLEDGTQASAPVIDRRETDTVVRVRGGETIVIGGLMRTAKRTTRSGVPVLSSIPLIGRLFGGYSDELDKRELVIFITPTIVAGQPPLAR